MARPRAAVEGYGGPRDGRAKRSARGWWGGVARRTVQAVTHEIAALRRELDEAVEAVRAEMRSEVERVRRRTQLRALELTGFLLWAAALAAIAVKL